MNKGQDTLPFDCWQQSQPNKERIKMSWTENKSQVYGWANEKMVREFEKASLQKRRKLGLTLRGSAGFARTAKGARRSLDAQLLEDANLVNTVPGTASNKGAIAEGLVSYADSFDWGTDIDDASVLASMDAMSFLEEFEARSPGSLASQVRL